MAVDELGVEILSAVNEIAVEVLSAILELAITKVELLIPVGALLDCRFVTRAADKCSLLGTKVLSVLN